ncbi:TPA: NTP transferase domain-containing protein [Citrobacter freundii]
MPSPVVIILAAGRAERFFASGATTHKLDAPLNGLPVAEHVLRAVKASGLAWHLVRPAGGTPGMGDSISLGVRATREASGWLILPADLPLIQPDSLLRVASALLQMPVVVPCYRQRQGHPVGFSRQFREALIALSGETGARKIVAAARKQNKVMDLDVADYGIVHDIDTLTDLQQTQQWLSAGKS